jgi:hypothetical protein
MSSVGVFLKVVVDGFDEAVSELLVNIIAVLCSLDHIFLNYNH